MSINISSSSSLLLITTELFEFYVACSSIYSQIMLILSLWAQKNVPDIIFVYHKSISNRLDLKVLTFLTSKRTPLKRHEEIQK